LQHAAANVANRQDMVITSSPLDQSRLDDTEMQQLQMQLQAAFVQVKHGATLSDDTVTDQYLLSTANAVVSSTDHHGCVAAVIDASLQACYNVRCAAY
jgi:hypothetical protein